MCVFVSAMAFASVDPKAAISPRNSERVAEWSVLGGSVMIRAESFGAATPPGTRVLIRDDGAHATRRIPMVNPGSRLGPYEFGPVIGVGGMGEVYRARDTKLNRDVALKVLPEKLSHDADRSARLLREARVLASLHHPNIAAIHGLEESNDGIRALVLELVEGPTLSDLIATAQPTLPLTTVLSISRQIADALEAAHEQQIVHRDLKPANIKVRPDGTVKVLDFGLAKALVGAEPSSGSLHSTLTVATVENAILGTPAYMSPEQARGKTVDKRTDIWAFGCILYEMLTGRRVFDGDHATEILAGVLERNPDFEALPHTTPPAIRRLLRRCLEKDWKRRLPDIAVARLEIDEAMTEPESTIARPTPATDSPRARWRERTAWLVAMAATLGVLAWLAYSGRQPDQPLLRFEIGTPPTSDAFAFALSPDGRQLVFVASADGTPLLWVRPLDQVAPQPLTGTERASYPFWSADGRSVAFFADGKLKRKDLTGGTPQVLADAPTARGGAWNLTGDIVFAPEATGGLKRVAATGGPVITVTDLAADHGSHRWPQFLPDGRRFLFFVGLGQQRARGVYLGSLDGEAPKHVLAGETAALFAPPDRLLRVVKDVLIVHRFDLERGIVDPMSRPVAQSVGTDDGTFHSAFSVSATGVLAHRPGVGTRRRLAWVDRAGNPLATLGGIDDGSPSSPELGHDGRRLAISRAPDGTGDIWLIDVERNVASRMTFDPGVDSYPVWSPDGARLIFNSGRNGRLDLFEKSQSGVGDERPLLTSDHDKAAQDWSPDGRFLLYTDQDPKTGSDLWAVPLEDSRNPANAASGGRQPIAVARSGFDETGGKFSPDGRWIAYVSNETGRHEIYVQPFPSLSSKLQLSTEGGIYPRWHPNGKELFYLATDMRLMALPIDVTSRPGSIEPGVPRPLFTTRMATTGPYVFSAGIFARPQYAVAPDGRFLLNLAEDVAAPPITFVVNWAAELTD